MRNGRILVTITVLAATLMWVLAPTAQAVDWLRPDTTSVSEFNWNDTANWQDVLDANGDPGTDGVGDIPGIGGFTNVDARVSEWQLAQNVTLNVDQPVDLGTGEFYVLTYSNNMTIKDSSGTNSASLTCGTYRCWRSSWYTISEIPIYASTKVMLGWRWGYVRFENVVETPLVEVGDGDMTFTALPNASDVYKFDEVTLWKDNQPVIPEMYVYDDIDPYTPDTPLTITIADGGIYGGYADGAFGTLAGNTVNISEGGTVIVGAAQTNFPNIIVEGGTTLVGDMTGLTSADFGLAGDGKKVTFEENSIYAPNPGSAEPTRAAMGGAILVKGIYDTSSASTTTVGDDGSTSLYKAAGFGAFGTSTAINTTVAVLPGIGNLAIFVTGRNADLGAGTTFESVTTKAVDLIVPNGAANVSLLGAINNGDLTGAKATTFNVSGLGSAQHDTILRAVDSNAEIAVGQTFNVKDGMAYINTSSNTTFLKGTLEIDAGGALFNGNYWAEPGDTQWHTPLSASGGTIAFKDRGLLFLPAGQEGILENVTVTASGTPYVVLGSGPWNEGNLVETYTLYSGTTPNILGLLKASNLWINADYDNTPVYFAGEGVTVGDGKWIQGIDGRTRSSKVAGTIRAEAGTTIGFAGIVDTLTVDANVVASGATVRFNTTETLETCVYNSSNPAGNAHTNNRLLGVVPGANINVNGEVTAETIMAQNGTVTFGQDLMVPNLDIAGTATVAMASGKTATVTNTLSGTGKWSGGNGVTVAAGGSVAPGASVGILNDGGGALTFDDGAIYQWQVANTGGDPGTAWDLVKASSITFQGDLVMDIDDSLLSIGSIDGTNSYIIATAGSMGALESYSFLGTWSGTLTVDGGNLVLTELSGALPGDADGDGDVDAADYIMVKTHFGGAPAAGTEGTGGDFNGNGVVDWDDLQTMMSGFNGDGESSTIPEPCSAMLLMFGAAAILRRRAITDRFRK